jgi:hypothetical protein
LIAVGNTYPAHTDEARAVVLSSPAGCVAGEPIAGWYDQMEALSTLRYPLMQAGGSLILGVMTCVALALIFPGRGNSIPKTPSSRLAFFIISFLAIVVHWIAFVFGLGLDQNRGDLPWCADSIGIPIFLMTPIYGLLMLLMGTVGLVLVRFFGDIPVNLFEWVRPTRIRDWGVNVVLLIGAIGIVLIALLDCRGSNFLATPSYVLLAYLFLATRSAMLAPRS